MRILLFCLLLTNTVVAQVIPDGILSKFSYRNIGPFRTGAWITGFAVPEKPLHDHLYTFYVGTRNGGLWKTANNGSTFENIFPYHHTIGAVAVAPSNANIVWTGTGESYATRSTYAGDGVYKSTDAGKTWQHMGLAGTQHIVRILIHPKNADVVYVVSPGHLFTPNAERGIFKTTDGGKTWNKIFFINDHVGAIDLVMHPNNPDILYAAAYEKYRSAWNLESGGKNSAIYKSINGGKTWTKLTNGLPTGIIGRIGIDICRTKPNILYAVVENLNPSGGNDNSGQPRTYGGEIYRSDNNGASWRKMNQPNDDVGGKAAYSFNQITVHPVNPDKIYITGASVAHSNDGGKTLEGLRFQERNFFPRSFGDVRTLWIDHQDPNRILFGSDGGIHISYDAGASCDYYDNLPVGEIYALDVDNDEPYNVYAGLQDHDSWKGPSNGWSGSITLENWVSVGSDDGMYNAADQTDTRWVYNTGQFGIHRRVDQLKGIRYNIEPKVPAGAKRYRYNWCTPIIVSPHDPATIYTGSQYLHKSTDRGDHWEIISPDLTTNDPNRIDGKGHIQFCTISTISESPLQKDVIWVGTDDGKVWLTKDGGKHWNEMTVAIEKAGGPAAKWVSRVTASGFDPAIAYVAKSGFRDDDFTPYLYKTTDYGVTWQAITNGLPQKSINVITEDPHNKQLLFVGNDDGVYVSANGGAQWQSLRGDMPMVPVHDIKIQAREKDLVVGSYGRGIFIADISYLEEISNDMLQNNNFLFTVEDKYYRVSRMFGANYLLYGTRHIRAPNEPNGLVINYYSENAIADSVPLVIKDVNGKTVFQTKLKAEKGLNSYTWGFNAGRRGTYTSMPEVNLEPGELTISLTIGGKEMIRTARYKGVKGWPVTL